MTENFYPATSIPGHAHLAHTHLPNRDAFVQNGRYAVSPVDGAHEDDGQISCFCGYSDDDGNTVGCDNCNRWNHIICYYPEYEGRDLPADLEHFCIECRPRPVDRHAANLRQRLKREQHDNYANEPKRPAAKSHKKKVKEPIGGYTNGWPVDKVRHDRNSASPRDQPPPAKRPKTSHRPSESTINGPVKSHARKRTAATNANHRRSLSRTPETPIDLYSPEFYRCYLDDTWNITHANLHNDIGVTNALSEWLRAPEDVFRETHGHEKSDVLSRWDGELEDIPGKAQLYITVAQDPSCSDRAGNTPTWKTITVQEPVASGAYLGELKGHVGFKDEYKSDPANRWHALRHPEPFVFFHPRLPIYIDARQEGTDLRFIRRSCQPNADLRVLVTDSTDYRFCFMATEQIDPGMEISVGWDTIEITEMMGSNPNGAPSGRDIEALSAWVSTVLANCGPCACGRSSSECPMARFDRRGKQAQIQDEDVQPVKMPRGRKKKAGQQISPLNTNAFNSRSGSEARKLDLDDEPTDSRSTSGSGGRASASRDITPNTHYSANGSTTMPELSLRERKKLEKEEEMFRRQEEERSSKGKKKRNSAGSTLNTPNPGSSKQLGASASRYADASTSRQAGLPTTKSSNGKRPRGATVHKPSAKVVQKTPKASKPEYVTHEVQCDMDSEDAQARAMVTSRLRKPFLSNQQRLLNRLALRNARLQAERKDSKGAKRSASAAGATEHQPLIPPTSPSSRISEPKPADSGPRAESPIHTGDVTMEDAPGEDVSEPRHSSEGLPHSSPISQASASAHDARSSHPPVDPQAPPWTAQASPTEEMPSSAAHSRKLPGMHMDMPPPPTNPFHGATSLSAGSGHSIIGTVAHSPASMPTSLFPPSVAAAVAPSPLKKKMSLSEYSKRNKTKDKGHGESKGDRESSPASVASGPSAPSLQASSSDPQKGGEYAAEDDVKMEDAGSKS